MLGPGTDAPRTAVGRGRAARVRSIPLPGPPPGCGWVFVTDLSGAHRPVFVIDGDGRQRPVYVEL